MKNKISTCYTGGVKNYSLAITILFLFSLNITTYAQTIIASSNPVLIHHSSKGAISKPKQHKPLQTNNSNYSAVLDYVISDSIAAYNDRNDSYAEGIQYMNSRYTLPDTGWGSINPNFPFNQWLLHSCTVVFDTIIDALSNTPYPSNMVKNLTIDTLNIMIGHKNISGTNDTIIVQIDSVDNNDYPTNKVLWSTRIITDTGLSPNNWFYNPYIMRLPTNYSLVNTNKFCITLQYYGSKLDTMGFGFGCPLAYDNLLGGFCPGNYPDTTSIGHKYNSRLIANSYTTGYRYYFPSDTTLPTSFGEEVLTIGCDSDEYTGRYPLYFQDIAISARVSFNSNVGGISGTLYVDKNANCTYGAGDISVPYISLQAIDSLNNIVATAISDSNGNYTLWPLNKGSKYEIRIDTNAGSGFTINCPVSGTDTVIAPTINNNIAITCSHGFDIGGYLYACIDTPTFGQVEVYSCIYNLGCLPSNAALKLVLDTAIHVTNSNIIADTLPIISGDTLMWKYSNIGPYGSGNSCIDIEGAAIDNLPIGDSVHFQLITVPAGGSSSANNIVNFWAPVFPHNCVGLPFDPNGKTVSPAGSISAQQKLTYNIHFQNTGTAVAGNVIVVDTLSPNLDVTTLHIVSSTSPMSVQINNGNIITFTFANIDLPDTGANKTASIGNVIYTIKPLNTVTQGTQILNTAGIYFDANPVVLTNTTVNTISGNTLSIQNIPNPPFSMICFPNPLSTTTSIVFNTNGTHWLELDDITGRRIETIKCTGKQYELNRNNLASGIYFIKAYDESLKYVATSKIVLL